MKKLSSAATIAFLSAFAPAHADGWDGFYGGLTAGYSSGDFGIAPVPLCGCTGFSFDADGGLGGVYAGYNFVYNSLVLGIEADAMTSGVDGSYGGIFPYGNPVTGDLDWLATIRGRIGVPVGQALWFATGGLAFGETSAGYDPPNESANHQGYVVGFGGEFRLSPRVSARAEYLFVGLGDEQVHLGSGEPIADVSLDQNIFRIGLTFELGQ